MKILAAKFFSLAFIVLSINAHAQVGIPVTDGGNLIQSTISALEDVAHTAKQIEQYQTQLQQYENQLMNSTPLTSAQWNDVRRIMSAMDSLVGVATRNANFGQDLEAYLGQYRDTDYYLERARNCYVADGCYDDKNRNDSWKDVNESSFQVIAEQQNELMNQAQRLRQLQEQATSAQGQMQAIQTANQLAAAQAAELMQIRASLLAQQNVITTYMSNQQDREARERAQFEQAISTEIVDTGNPVGY